MLKRGATTLALTPYLKEPSSMSLRRSLQMMTLRQLGSALITCLVTLSACGGSQTPSAELLIQLKASPASRFEGSLDTSPLTPVGSVEGELDLDALGRELKPAEKSGDFTLLPPSPCGKLIPAKRVLQHYRDRLDEVFDEHLLTARRADQTSLTFPKMDHKAPLPKGGQAGDVISAYLGLDRVLSFVDLKELKHYERCCELTGTCGPRMVSTLYEVKRGVHSINPADPTLRKTLLAFEQKHGDSLNAQKRKTLAVEIYKAQTKVNPRGERTAISHIEHRALPAPLPAPLTQVALNVTPSTKIRCKGKKQKRASAVEFTITLGGVDTAEELLGYEITTSNKWVDLSLVKHNPRVRVGTGKIGCVPGEEAFTNYEHVCPKEIMLMAFPPACGDVKGKGAGDFAWTAEASIYAPGEAEASYHKVKSSAVVTTVHTR